MPHHFIRTALILLATSAICAPDAAAAAGLRPNFPIRLPEAAPAQPTAVRAEDAPTATAPEAAKPALRLTPLAVQTRSLAAPAPRAQAPVQVDEWPEAKPELIKVAARKRTPARAAAREEAPAEAQTYTVRKGDTLDKVADKLGTSVAELKRINKLKGSTIHRGQKLTGPAVERPAKASPSSSKKSRARAEAATPEHYTVRRGDTLFSIAKKTGVSVEELRAENGIARRGSIHAGQKLKLPGAEPEPVAEETPAPRRGRNATRAERTSPREEDTAEETGSDGRTVTTRSVTGRVIEVAGGASSYKVRKGDTLDEIADKLGTSVAQLKKDNRLRKSAIRPGQVLRGPRTTAKAYVAGSGDTLAAIAKRFSVSPEALRSANGLRRNAAIRSGQRIKLPSGYRDRGAVTVTTRVPTPAAEAPPPPRRIEPTPAPIETPRAEPTPALPSRPQPYSPGGRTPSRPAYTPPRISAPPTAAPTPGPALSDAQVSQLGRGRFILPVNGEIISAFGPKAGGQRNDGINIRVAAGTSVKAAADGDVVYAGDQVPGFGNLVLVKHDDGWVTAYGHLSKVDVRMQQKVSQGQQIGLSGATGGVAEPQLHFEVRFAPSPLDRARPIDPSLVLPR